MPPLVSLAARLVSSLQHPATARAVTYNSAKKALEVAFDDGATFTYPAELLRVESPSIDSQLSRRGSRRKVIHGRRHVGIMGIEQVGNYAVRIQFDDLHQSGIYSWEFLHRLGQQKYQRIKAYLRLLREQGLSRDPPKGPRPPRPQ